MKSRAYLSGHRIAKPLELCAYEYLVDRRLRSTLNDWSEERLRFYAYHLSRRHPPVKVRAFLKQRWTAIDELITELHVQARRAVIDEAQVGDIHGAFGPFAKGITVRGKVAIDHLKPYPRNARTHSRTQLQQIADSIRRFGFVNPPLVDDNGQIIAGHGRVEAAKLLGLTRSLSCGSGCRR